MKKINSKIGRIWDDYLNEIPDYITKKGDEVYGELTKPGYGNPVSNLNIPFYKFNNSHLFSPAAYFWENSNKGKFEATYTTALPGTKDYRAFWEQERLRCLKGYEPIIDGAPCGIKITGEHYFYLNYCRIKKAVKDEDTGEDTERLGFPMFCSMDFYWFKILQQCENPKNVKEKINLIAAKARRKGFSFKNAAGAVWKYSFFKESKVVIASEFGGKAKNTFDMCLDMIDFLNQYTEFRSPWTNRKSNQNKCYIRSGIEIERNGKKYIKGKKSIIETVSLHNKPDGAAGLSSTRVIFEEAGMIKNLKKAWAFTEPTLRSGAIRKGIAIIFGTGGDMDGSTRDFADMFYDPEPYKLRSFDNIYEDTNSSNKCGWFVDDMWFREGSIINLNGKEYKALDENGNAYKWVAELDLNVERDAVRKGDKEAYNTTISQYCKTPSEAFLVTDSSIFPAAEIYERIQRIKLNKNKRLLGTNGSLVYKGNKVEFKVDKNNLLNAIDYYPLKSNDKNKEGCIIQYEAPQAINGELKIGSYIISVDPIKIDTETGESLIAIYCFKTKKYAPIIGHDELVMSYIGRPKYNPMDTTNHMLLKMSKYYNALVSHENDVNASAIRNFFIEKKQLHMLMSPPGSIVEKYIPNSKTNQRKTGHSLGSSRMKEIAEQYVKKWLLEERGINPNTGEMELNLDRIYDLGLLQELYRYNRKDNFDRVSALMGLILQQEQLIHNMNLSEPDEEKSLPSAFFLNSYKNLINRRI